MYYLWVPAVNYLKPNTNLCETNITKCKTPDGPMTRETKPCIFDASIIKGKTQTLSQACPVSDEFHAETRKFSCPFHRFPFPSQFLIQSLVAMPPTKVKASTSTAFTFLLFLKSLKWRNLSVWYSTFGAISRQKQGGFLLHHFNEEARRFLKVDGPEL